MLSVKAVDWENIWPKSNINLEHEKGNVSAETAMEGYSYL